MDSNTPTLMRSEEERAPWNDDINVVEMDKAIDIEYVLQKHNVNVVTTSDDDDLEECYDNKHYTVLELLGELATYIKQDLVRYKGSKAKERWLNEMLQDCQGWELYDKSYSESE
jgi:hypothetical protein